MSALLQANHSNELHLAALAEQMQHWAERYNIPYRSRTCTALAWISGLRVFRDPTNAGASICRFVPKQMSRDEKAEDHRLALTGAERMKRYGIEIDPTSCRRHRAEIGRKRLDYQLCNASLLN